MCVRSFLVFPLQGQSGLKGKELSGVLSRVVSARESMARQVPQYWRHREEVVLDLEQRLQDRRRGSEPAAYGSPRAKARAATAQGTVTDEKGGITSKGQGSG